MATLQPASPGGLDAPNPCRSARRPGLPGPTRLLSETLGQEVDFPGCREGLQWEWGGGWSWPRRGRGRHHTDSQGHTRGQSSFLSLSGQAAVGQPEPWAGGPPPPPTGHGCPAPRGAQRQRDETSTRLTHTPGGQMSLLVGEAMPFCFLLKGKAPKFWAGGGRSVWDAPPTPHQRPRDMGAAASGHGRRDHLAMLPLQSHLRGRRTAACCTWSRSPCPGQGGFQPPELRTGQFWVPGSGGSEGRHSRAELSRGADETPGYKRVVGGRERSARSERHCVQKIENVPKGSPSVFQVRQHVKNTVV